MSEININESNKSIIEKHFTLDKKSKGVDSKFSLEPKELSALVKESFIAWKSLGNIFYGSTKNEKKSLINIKILSRYNLLPFP